MTEPSLTQQVLDRCRDALFTGILRVRTRQAAGELWFLSGILERVRFGVSTGNEALSRLLAATSPQIDVVACLPNPAGGFEKGHPMEGELGTTLPVDLLRFCETHALTCTVHLRAGDSSGEAIYRLGELISIRSDAGTDRAVATMLEWNEGRFRLTLPSIDLPTSVEGAGDAVSTVEPAEEPMTAESEAWRTAANEALRRKVVEGEAKRKAEEKRQADEALIAEPARAAEELRGAVQAPAFSIIVSLQRVTTEYVHISVPVTDAMRMSEPEADGSYRVSSEALFAEAERLARESSVAWQPDGEPRVSIHPMQTPPRDPRS
jgi:hypothetical protein